VDLAAPTDGSGRLFVVEQTGRIQILIDGQVQAEPFLDISDRISIGGSEQGLLGLALHPNYIANGFFFVNYTDVNGNTVIARYRVSDNPDKADPASELVLLNVDQPYENHNGGAVRFGPDGYLYLGLGDGGSGGDPQGNGQNPNTLLGKILRIDVNQADGYSIPPGNLYPNGEGRPEIYATGLRNPWRFSFDPFNGDLYIADVGQNLWEEIDILPAAPNNSRNYGWNFFEGAHEYASLPAEGMEFIPPVWEYDHSQGCSVTGGVVYNGQTLPAWKGVYIFADYCSGLVWGLLKTPEGFQSALLYQTGAAVSSFGEDADGEVYLLDLNGRIYRLEPSL
ncbi:MAG: sorbosone dehydrogenase family protein, partial [Anaerolineaceae bacterium]